MAQNTSRIFKKNPRLLALQWFFEIFDPRQFPMDLAVDAEHGKLRLSYHLSSIALNLFVLDGLDVGNHEKPGDVSVCVCGH